MNIESTFKKLELFDKLPTCSFEMGAKLYINESYLGEVNFLARFRRYDIDARFVSPTVFVGLCLLHKEGCRLWIMDRPGIQAIYAWPVDYPRWMPTTPSPA